MQTNIITLTAGTMAIELWPIGARLNAVSWNGFENMVNGSTTSEEARGAKLNHGSVVGPVANRIAGARFELDGTEYRFPPNEGADTIVHSGDTSLRDRVWEVDAADGQMARFATDVPDMADGFPGNRRFEATYTVMEDGFDLTLSAKTDRATLVNLALHPYWTLDAGGRDGLRLMVNADRYLPIDQKKIPVGPPADVSGTLFDLRQAKVPSTEIDHNYCLNTGGTSCALNSDRVVLDIATDAPGLQVFTGKEIGIAIEPQHWPDTPNRPDFPSIRLEPGATYSQTSRYRFSNA